MKVGIHSHLLEESSCIDGQHTTKVHSNQQNQPQSRLDSTWNQWRLLGYPSVIPEMGVPLDLLIGRMIINNGILAYLACFQTHIENEQSLLTSASIVHKLEHMVMHGWIQISACLPGWLTQCRKTGCLNQNCLVVSTPSKIVETTRLWLPWQVQRCPKRPELKGIPWIFETSQGRWA